MLSKKRMEVAVKKLQYNFDLLKDIRWFSNCNKMKDNSSKFNREKTKSY